MEGGDGPQRTPTFCQAGRAGLPGPTPPNSGKSAIFTSNVSDSVCADLGLSAELGADLVPLKSMDKADGTLRPLTVFNKPDRCKRVTHFIVSGGGRWW